MDAWIGGVLDVPLFCVSDWLILPGAQQSPPVAALDLQSVFKAGYLEKRRKGGSPGLMGCGQAGGPDQQAGDGCPDGSALDWTSAVMVSLSYRSQLLWYRVAEEMVCA